MVPLTNPFVAAAVVSTLVGLTAATVVWTQRDTRAAWSYVVLQLVLTVWAALYVGELLGTTIAAKRPWLLARHALSPAIPLAFWVYAARYTDKPELLVRRYLAPIVGLGLVFALFPVLDPGGLYWRSVQLTSIGSLPVLDIALGPLFWLMGTYITVVVGIAHVHINRMAWDSFSVYRRQLFASSMAGAIGFAMFALFLSEHVSFVPVLNPFPNLQILAYGVALFLIPRGWMYYRDAFLSMQPLATRTVIGNMEDAVLVLDQDGAVRKTNEPARELLATGGGDVTDQPIEAALDDWPTLLEEYERLSSSDRSTTEPGAAIALDVGVNRRFVDLSISPVNTGAGENRGTVVVIRDVTEEATRRQRLERKNQQLERLADVVSHDMRAPLSTAEKLTALLRQDIDDPDESVERSLQDLASLHERLQEFADHLPRLAREGTDIDSPVECELDGVAEAAWQVIETEAVTLEIESTTTLSGDPRRLQQAFENLFRNSIEHGRARSPTADGSGAGDPRAGSTVAEPDPESDGDQQAATRVDQRTDRDVVTTVRVGVSDDGFYVADDGPGIPPERREEVFEYGVSGSDGSGFGLAIVRAIVEAHGWTIQVTDGTDGGARFEVRTNPSRPEAPARAQS